MKFYFGGLKPTKKMNKAINFIYLLLLVTIISCGDDDGDEAVPGAAATISLADLKRGEGMINVSGNETFTLSTGGTLVASPLTATINGKDYEVFRVTLSDLIESNSLSVSLSFYIPTSLNRSSPPNGTFIATTEGAALDETYVEIFVIGADEGYNTFTASTGTVTVSNTTSTEFPYVFDIEFDVKNLTSFDDLTVDVQGAMKWGL